MPTQLVELSAESVEILEASIESGDFEDAQEAMDEAMHLLASRDTIRAARLKALIAEAEQDFAEGRFTTLHTKEDINNMMKDIWQRVLGSETS